MNGRSSLDTRRHAAVVRMSICAGISSTTGFTGPVNGARPTNHCLLSSRSAHRRE